MNELSKHLDRLLDGLFRLFIIIAPIVLLIIAPKIALTLVLVFGVAYFIGWGSEYIKKQENERDSI